MSVVYQYRVRCVTENVDKYVWDEEEPTVCPTNAEHTIGAIAIVNKVDSNVVAVREETTPTGGHFQTVTRKITADGNATTHFNYTWPMPITVFMVGFTSEETHRGDVIDMSVAPNTTIGIITADATVGTSTFTVSNTVLQYTNIGFYLTITDGVNNDDLGRVIAIDKNTSTVTVETASTHSFLVTSPSYIIQNIYMMKDYEIGAPHRYEIGESKIGGSYVPAGTVVRVSYTNNGLAQKNIVTRLEYLY